MPSWRSAPDPKWEAEKTRIAIHQLERVEDHLVATINLELEQPELRLALHRLRADALRVRDTLARPRAVR